MPLRDAKLFQKITNTFRMVGKKSRIWFIVLILASLFLSFVEYFLAAFVQVFLFSLKMIPIDVVPKFLVPFTKFDLTILLLGLIFVGFTRSLGMLLVQQASMITYEALNTRLKNLVIYIQLLSKNRRFLSNSTIQWYFSEIFIKASQCISQIIQAVPSCLQIIFLSAALIALAPKETVIGFFGLIIVAYLIKTITRGVFKLSSLVPIEGAIVNKVIQRITQNWVFVRIGGVELEEYKKFASALLKYYNYYARTRLLGGISIVLPPFLGIVLLAVIILISNKYLNTPPANLLMFLYIFVRLVQQLSSVTTAYNNIVTNFPQLKIAYKFFNSIDREDEKEASIIDAHLESYKAFDNQKLQEAISLKASNSRLSSNQVNFSPEINIRNLWFKWTDDQEWVVRDLNLTIKAGSAFGIIGPSGVGKSTLLNLILGVLKPQIGSVEIANINAEEFLSTNNHIIGYVGPDPFMFEGTLIENLLYGNKWSINEEEIWNALQFAKIADTVKTMPNGLQHIMSEIGEGLSTGQKQRIAIARAILRKPKLLILDEATANLDVLTEKSIAESLTKLKSNCTIIVVSHKAGMLSLLDDKIEL